MKQKRMLHTWYFLLEGNWFYTRNKNEFDFLKMFAEPQMKIGPESNGEEIRNAIDRLPWPHAPSTVQLIPAKRLLDEMGHVNRAKGKKYISLKSKLTLKLSEQYLDAKLTEHLKKLAKKLGLNKMKFISKT